MHDIEYISSIEYTFPPMMVMLYSWIRKNEYAPKRWREGVVVNLFKKGDTADPGNYRGITLLGSLG